MRGRCWFMTSHATASARCRAHRRLDPPGNILLLAVDRHTGQPVEPGTPGAITEAFIAGTQPGTGFPR